MPSSPKHIEPAGSFLRRGRGHRVTKFCSVACFSLQLCRTLLGVLCGLYFFGVGGAVYAVPVHVQLLPLIRPLPLYRPIPARVILSAQGGDEFVSGKLHVQAQEDSGKVIWDYVSDEWVASRAGITKQIFLPILQDMENPVHLYAWWEDLNAGETADKPPARLQPDTWPLANQNSRFCLIDPTFSLPVRTQFTTALHIGYGQERGELDDTFHYLNHGVALPPESLISSMAVLSAWDAILLRGNTWRSLSPSSRKMLRQWVGAGGLLFLVADDSSFQDLVQELNCENIESGVFAARIKDLGFMVVWHENAVNALSLPDWPPLKRLVLKAELDLDANGMSMAFHDSYILKATRAQPGEPIEIQRVKIGYYSSMSYQSSEAFDSLGRIDLSRMAGYKAILAIGCAVLLVGFLEPLLLKKIKRRHWTWLTFPGICLVLGAVFIHYGKLKTQGAVSKAIRELTDVDAVGQVIQTTHEEVLLPLKNEIWSRTFKESISGVQAGQAYRISGQFPHAYTMEISARRLWPYYILSKTFDAGSPPSFRFPFNTAPEASPGISEGAFFGAFSATIFPPTFKNISPFLAQAEHDVPPSSKTMLEPILRPLSPFALLPVSSTGYTVVNLKTFPEAEFQSIRIFSENNEYRHFRYTNLDASRN